VKTKNRPWIQPNRKPICDSILKRISRTWDAETWEAYLSWYQKPLKEALIKTFGYELICEGMTDTIYREYGYDHDEFLQKYVEILLRRVSNKQASVLRLYYLEGLTELQISQRLRVNQSSAHRRKTTALFNLSQENPEGNCIAIHIMRGLSSLFENENAPVLNDETELFGHNNEQITIADDHVVQAISELPERQRQITYLRFCDNLSDAAIARQYGMGINAVQDIYTAAASRIKRRAVELNQQKVVKSCA
jgi:DNA-directed RNA polymerase specialized sigma subunit